MESLLVEVYVFEVILELALGYDERNPEEECPNRELGDE
jgi:hypothetical protein